MAANLIGLGPFAVGQRLVNLAVAALNFSEQKSTAHGSHCSIDTGCNLLRLIILLLRVFLFFPVFVAWIVDCTRSETKQKLLTISPG